MLSSNYRECVWKANGELDCGGMQGSIPLSRRPHLNSACQSLPNVPNCFSCDPRQSQYDNTYQLALPYGQVGGSDPAPWYPSTGPGQCLDMVSYSPYATNKCSQPSGPMIATSGFDRNALWVSPTYHQPPRDYHPPQNAYYNPRGGGKKNFVQTKLSDRYYQVKTRPKNRHAPPRTMGKVAPTNNAHIPAGMYPNYPPDLRYRQNLQDIPAQAQYENMLSSYNQGPTYAQTDFDYNNQMNQEYFRQATAVGFQPSNHLGLLALPPPAQIGGSDATYDTVSRPQFWNAQGDGIEIDGYSSLYTDKNPSIGVQTNIVEAFQSPLLNVPNSQDTRWSPSYTDNTSLYDAAPVQLQATSPWMYYETPYAQQQPAPKQIAWIPAVTDKLRILTRELGAPYLIDRKSGGFALWNQSSLNRVYWGIFKRIELHDEEIPCNTPYPHRRNLYTWVRLDVPTEDLGKLLLISPNITYDMTKRWLCISGATLKGNYAILTLVCMHLQNRLRSDQIEQYQLQKKYLWAMIPKSQMYHPLAKRTFYNIIKKSLR